MKIGRPILIISILSFVIAATAPSIGAEDDIPGVFNYTFDNVDPIKIHAGPATFNHIGHVKDHGISCQACHHTLDEDETEVEEHCNECHTRPGFIRGKEAEEMDEEELVEHYLNALHMQCIDCHREKKIEDRKRKIPVGCTQCHDRSKLRENVDR